MTIADIKKTAEQKMAKSIEAFKHELHKIRTGRAHPGLLDQVQVDYYGSMVPISQVANVTLMDARTISVQPWEKGMGAKIAVRSVRREGNEHLKKLLKDKEVSEDDERRAQDEVQRLTDRTISEIDRLVQGKEAEVMAV
ncbi:MAG: ribosome-recycling factor [Rubrivivax sp.]|nr:ribosome-recycling factor [Rubrivivax sp.]